MAKSSGISKWLQHDPYVLDLFIPQGCRPITTHCILSSFQVAYQDRMCERAVSLDVWSGISKEGAPQVFIPEDGHLVRDVGNRIHSQLKKGVHNRPRGTIRALWHSSRWSLESYWRNSQWEAVPFCVYMIGGKPYYLIYTRSVDGNTTANEHVAPGIDRWSVDGNATVNESARQHFVIRMIGRRKRDS